MHMRNFRKDLIIVTLMAAVLCSAHMPNAYAEDVDDTDISAVSDPIEGVNRIVYGFNHFLDVILFKPIAKGYRLIVPSVARKGVHNVLTNLTEPVTMINSLLQGDLKNTGTAFCRFTVNSTFGVAGLFDIAQPAGLPHRKEDFGQTVGVYGAGQGAYIMLPVLGPSNVRDTLGLVVDTFTDPFDYILQDEALMIRTGVNGLDKREATLNLIDQIEKTSLDPYAAIRSLYTQKRMDEIRNGMRQ